MKRSFMIAKLHGLRVTGADLHYEGSIALDPRQCALAGILPLEFVEIWNKHTGARISTYVIYGEPGSRCCILNGAAARTCQAGDELIIAARADIDMSCLTEVCARVVVFDEHNQVRQLIEQRLCQETSGHWNVVSQSYHPTESR
jgi:aspartate 1-decarboxylase